MQYVYYDEAERQQILAEDPARETIAAGDVWEKEGLGDTDDNPGPEDSRTDELCDCDRCAAEPGDPAYDGWQTYDADDGDGDDG